MKKVYRTNTFVYKCAAGGVSEQRPLCLQLTFGDSRDPKFSDGLIGRCRKLARAKEYLSVS